jgi:2,4-dienoyl-CoA reductase-like NADH-dependent reductase (Old Yellow Enzyme family)
MAPLTRNRAAEGTLAPNDMMAEYYEQRASDGGLLITEVSFLVNINANTANARIGNISIC